MGSRTLGVLLMSDVILQGSVDDIGQLLQEFSFPSESWMLLEREDDWFQREGQEKIVFDVFQQQPDIGEWAKGCVFCRNGEVRWFQAHGGYQVVFTGEECNSSLEPADINLTDCDIQEPKYLLWGKKLDNPEEYGIASESSVFLEMQIPRLLTYPVSDDTDRVWLHVREFISQKTGLLVHSRWFDLGREVNEPA